MAKIQVLREPLRLSIIRQFFEFDETGKVIKICDKAKERFMNMNKK